MRCWHTRSCLLCRFPLPNVESHSFFIHVLHCVRLVLRLVMCSILLLFFGRRLISYLSCTHAAGAQQQCDGRANQQAQGIYCAREGRNGKTERWKCRAFQGCGGSEIHHHGCFSSRSCARFAISYYRHFTPVFVVPLSMFSFPPGAIQAEPMLNLICHHCLRVVLAAIAS